MKGIFTLLFTLFFVCTFAQITITNASFLSAGDTIRVLTDRTIDGILPSPGGGDQVWDYSSLSSGTLGENEVLEASEGEGFDDFPGADLVVKLGLQAENFLIRNEETVGLIGFSGGDFGGNLFDVPIKYSEPYIIQRAPLNYEDEDIFITTLFAPAAREDIPDTLISQIPDAIVFDSIRLRIDIEQSSDVDAWGTMHIPGASYEVLRENKFELRETKIEVKLGFIGWSDISSLIEDLIPGVLGLDTIQYHYFFAEGINSPIAILQMDGDGEPVSVDYKYEGIVTATYKLSRDQPDFVAYPNPAVHKITLSSTNIPDGGYTVRIFNLLGQDAYREVHKFKGQEVIDINVAFLKRGSYFYSILDSKGKPFKTKRLVIIRP